MTADIEVHDTTLSRHETFDEKVLNSESEYANLRRIPDTLPKIALLILALGETSTYFGLSGPIQNYINNPYAPDFDLPSDLGKGQSTATVLGNSFESLAYASTIIGAIVAEQYLGKFKAILAASSVHIFGLVTLFATAKPSTVQSGAGLGGLVGGRRETWGAKLQGKIFLFLLFLPFRFMCWIQIWNNSNSKAGELTLHGTPNDLVQNLDPIPLIIFISFLDLVVLPGRHTMKINFDPVPPISAGFLLVSISMVYAITLQHYIYTSDPSSIHLWVQAPVYIFVALSEAFVSLMASNWPSHRHPQIFDHSSPPCFWLTIGITAAICIALAAVSQDPYMV
ncbi:hypothetical protein T440DRAFT_520575 [Plenodomus tracheiphilus IPT5]|uniref:PTR2-domain-containing protein n=1 Tax=Plenodomus tracheiphilus IPT5 TaxID=1408161 RepID=A0A6A7AXZ3_9PLEO|nr:hypothetical protein T440DRAFT_520575 [Plenodomus tracheiphilus IPT5]